MPKGTYGNGKPKASKGRAKTRARRKLLFQAMTDLASLSPQRVKPIKGRPAKSTIMALKSSVKKLAGIATHKKMMGGLSEPNKVVPGAILDRDRAGKKVHPAIRHKPPRGFRRSHQPMIWWTGGSKRKTGERGVR